MRVALFRPSGWCVVNKLLILLVLSLGFVGLVSANPVVSISAVMADYRLARCQSISDRAGYEFLEDISGYAFPYTFYPADVTLSFRIRDAQTAMPPWHSQIIYVRDSELVRVNLHARNPRLIQLPQFTMAEARIPPLSREDIPNVLLVLTLEFAEGPVEYCARGKFVSIGSDVPPISSVGNGGDGPQQPYSGEGSGEAGDPLIPVAGSSANAEHISAIAGCSLKNTTGHGPSAVFLLLIILFAVFLIFKIEQREK